MSIPTLAKYEEETNKKLLYANILIELAGTQTQKHYFDALKYSYVIQMLAAYYSLLEESQRRLNLAPEPGLNAEELLQKMRSNSVHSVEIEQLVSLERDRGSWLHQLKQLYQELSASASMSNINLINSPNGPNGGDGGDAEDDAANTKKYEGWLKQLEDLTSNLREMLSES